MDLGASCLCWALQPHRPLLRCARVCSTSMQPMEPQLEGIKQENEIAPFSNRKIKPVRSDIVFAVPSASIRARGWSRGAPNYPH